ncbi:MAG: capsule assembly Wzi family protein, partial [Steroidobacteraceae bacterium]
MIRFPMDLPVSVYGAKRALRTAVTAGTLVLAGLAGLAASTDAHASGASPYLPLNLSPEIERKVEQVLILAGAPVMTRPVPVARVLAALPAACERDRVLCTQVRHYLDRYFHTVALTHASVEVAAASRSGTALPDAHGERPDAPVDASAVASYRPFDHLLLSVGGVAYGGTDGRFNPDGTMLSLGDEYLQLDAGYRDQWLSPSTDSSMLISTEAPTMPSVTLSNQKLIGPAGFEYQLFVASMSHTDLITWNGGYTSGNPRLAGVHLGIEPAAGWALSGNALYQYGGGARPASLGGLFDFLFTHTTIGSCSSTSTNCSSTDSRFANREISITSSYTFPGSTPLETYVEYAGRDSLHGELYRFRETD